MNMKKLSATWQITLLSPLHIGDGEELVCNLDYMQSSSGLDVMHPDDLLTRLETIPRAISEIGGTQFDLGSFVGRYKIPLKPQYTLPFSGPPPQSVRRFLKDAYIRPYLPGSSLKGAIRTALWMQLDHSGLPPVARYKDFREGVKRLAGEDPHHDFLRPLQISDSSPTDPDGSLELEEIKFFNVRFGNQAGWKDFAGKQTKDDFKKATGIYLEALRPGVQLFVQASLDRLLTTESIKSIFKIPDCPGSKDFEVLANAVNRQSLAVATAEKGFFAQFGAATAAVTAYYGDLIQKIRETEKIAGAFILRLAWGSGWKGMTGDWIEDADMEEVRRRNSLGKSGCPYCNSRVKWNNRIRKVQCRNKSCGKVFGREEKWFHPIFPKTRRLAMKDGVPSVPLGWVLVKPIEQNILGKKAALCSGLAADADMTSPSPEPAPPDPEQLRKETVTQFKAALAHSQNLPGDIDLFIGRVRNQDEEELQKELCSILLKNAKKLPKRRKFSKALAAGKSWAKRLKALCDELGISV